MFLGYLLFHVHSLCSFYDIAAENKSLGRQKRVQLQKRTNGRMAENVCARESESEKAV